MKLICKLFGHSMFFNTANIFGGSTCKWCGHKEPPIKITFPPMPEIKTAKITNVFKTEIWIENHFIGSKSVMIQHEGCEPFCYCTFNYNYQYTDNSSIKRAAEKMAISLGAKEPVIYNDSAPIIEQPQAERRG